MKTNLRTILLAVFSLFCFISCTTEKTHQNEKDEFITKLMNNMFVEEKIAQLNLVTPSAGTGPFKTKRVVEKLQEGSAGNILSVMGSVERIHKTASLADSTRLKIPFFMALDIIHGYKTIFPIPLGLSCSWDTVLIEKTARIAAIEGTAMGYNQTYSPMVDITRDPRWGRVMEGAGEDPYLGSVVARAVVKGYQGDDLNDETSMMACVKHFGLYGASEAGRDYNTTDMSRLTMFQYYLPPYKAAIDAGAGSIMSSFNDVDGVPATANKWLLTDLLRDEWGFDGVVVSDYNCVQELIAHGVAADYKEAVKKAMDAGLDMDMASEGYSTFLKNLVNEGAIKIEQIDQACRRVLEGKYDLGLFEDPYKNYNPEKPAKVILTEENKEVAKLAVCKSIVLLKNDNNTLPLNKNSKIALIGPSVDDQFEMFSMWSQTGDRQSVITILDGIRKLNENVVCADGTFFTDDPDYLKNDGRFDEAEQFKKEKEAVEIATKSDVIVAVLGESIAVSGEARSMTDISLPGCQVELLKKLKATGKPVVLVLLSGRPLTLEDNLQYADAVLEAWRPGTMAGAGLADVLFGDYNPSGKLTMTFPRSLGQIPIYYNHKHTGRPYIEGEKSAFKSRYLDEKNDPLFPFGFGMSYTSFGYSPISLSDTLMSGNTIQLDVSVDVSNTGDYAGEETVQLYLNDPVASVARPVKELKKFRKVFLQPGESQRVHFKLSVEDLKFYNYELKWDWEPGKFIVYVGTNSEEIQKASFVWNR
ncbi:beta-glucosidase BglX [Mangrovibacterium lignilyticum]|uniref:beta-glucosidase BglX n=1 Tax=Mangrovibacterium lignilyticum TaxID=2668052 RepID=UPI0013D74BDA|nr:beta-glucosidase BglX [Mangrovibacterium lignilyticum]